MITLAIVEQESQMGGVEHSTLAFASSIDRARFTPVVIAPEPGPLTQRCALANIPVLLSPRPAFRSASVRMAGRTIADPLAVLVNIGRLRQVAGQLEQRICACQADVVLTKGLLAHFYGGWAARRLGLPCIWHVQDEVPEQRALGLYLRALRSAADLLAAAVIGDAASIARQFEGHRHVTTVYNGVDTGVFSPASAPGALRSDLGIPATALVVGNLARLTDWKGQHVLIDAFHRVADSHPQAHLALIGSALFDDGSYERRLRQAAASGPAAGRIHFAGYRDDTAAALASLDVYVHPSVRKDTAPLALLSALASGLPAIVSDVPGMLEVVEPGESALVVPAGQDDVLANTLNVVLSQPEMRERLARTARAEAVRRFSIQAHTAALMSIVERVASCTGNIVSQARIQDVVELGGSQSK